MSYHSSPLQDGGMDISFSITLPSLALSYSQDDKVELSGSFIENLASMMLPTTTIHSCRYCGFLNSSDVCDAEWVDHDNMSVFLSEDQMNIFLQPSVGGMSVEVTCSMTMTFDITLNLVTYFEQPVKSGIVLAFQSTNRSIFWYPEWPISNPFSLDFIPTSLVSQFAWSLKLSDMSFGIGESLMVYAPNTSPQNYGIMLVNTTPVSSDTS